MLIPADSMPPYPSAQEFADLLRGGSLLELARNFVFGGLPYVFRDAPEQHDLLKEHLSASLGVDRSDLVVVGSAKIGFSLGPDTFPRAFGDWSDIDVAVVSPTLFDRIWMAILRWHYPRRVLGLTGPDQPWGAARRKELYWGWMTPDDLRFEGLSYSRALTPLRDLSTTWFNGFQSLSRYPQFADRTVTGRLYRTWNHAFLYHVDGLRQIRSLNYRG